MSTQCKIYLHPTAASNPAVISAICAATGLFVVIGGNRAAATLTKRSTPSTGPWPGGSAA